MVWYIYGLYLGSTTQLPIIDNFNNGQFGTFQNITGDDFNWTVYSGETPSNGTGPLSNYDGYYAYIETSNPNNPYKSAILEATFDFDTRVTMDFAYNLYSSTNEALKLEIAIQYQGESSFTNIFTIQNNQGNPWQTGSVSIDPGNVTIRIIGTSGSSFRGDVAIDSITIDESPPEPAPEPAPAPEPEPAQELSLPFVEDFSAGFDLFQNVQEMI